MGRFAEQHNADQGSEGDAELPEGHHVGHVVDVGQGNQDEQVTQNHPAAGYEHGFPMAQENNFRLQTADLVGQDPRQEPQEGKGALQEGVDDGERNGVVPRIGHRPKEVERVVVDDRVARGANGGDEGEEAGTVSVMSPMPIGKGGQGQEQHADHNKKAARVESGVEGGTAPHNAYEGHQQDGNRPGEGIGHGEVPALVGPHEARHVEGLEATGQQETAPDLRGDDHEEGHVPQDNGGEEDVAKHQGDREEGEVGVVFLPDKIPGNVGARGSHNKEDGGEGHGLGPGFSGLERGDKTYGLYDYTTSVLCPLPCLGLTNFHWPHETHIAPYDLLLNPLHPPSRSATRR